MTNLITPAFKSLFTDAINLALQDNALTESAQLISIREEKCPDCTAVTHGVCITCQGRGILTKEISSEIFLMVETNKRKFTNKLPVNYVGDAIQTLCKIDRYVDIRKAAYLLYNQRKYERVGEPEICGLGSSSYISTVWKNI